MTRKGRTFHKRTPKKLILSQHDRVIAQLQQLRDSAKLLDAVLQLIRESNREAIASSYGPGLCSKLARSA